MHHQSIHSSIRHLLLSSETARDTPSHIRLGIVRTHFELGQSSMTSMWSLVVPKDSSRTVPAEPSFSGLSSSNLHSSRLHGLLLDLLCRCGSAQGILLTWWPLL